MSFRNCEDLKVVEFVYGLLMEFGISSDTR